MVKKRQIIKEIKLEKKEEKWLAAEYYYLTELKQDILDKDKRAAVKIARRMGSCEYRLERIHKKVLSRFEDLKESISEKAMAKFNEIEKEIEVFRADLVKELSRFSGELKYLITQEKWDELANSVVVRIEKDIRGWKILDDRLIEFEEHLVEVEKIKKDSINIFDKFKKMTLVAGFVAAAAIGRPLLGESLKNKDVKKFMGLNIPAQIETIRKEILNKIGEYDKKLKEDDKKPKKLADQESKIKSEEELKNAKESVANFKKGRVIIRKEKEILEDYLKEVEKGKKSIAASDKLSTEEKEKWISKYKNIIKEISSDISFLEARLETANKLEKINREIIQSFEVYKGVGLPKDLLQALKDRKEVVKTQGMINQLHIKLQSIYNTDIKSDEKYFEKTMKYLTGIPPL